MTVFKEIEAAIVTARLQIICEEAGKIGKEIGDMPVQMFPVLRQRLIAISTEELELERRLYNLYSEANEMERAKLVLTAMENSKSSLYLLTR